MLFGGPPQRDDQIPMMFGGGEGPQRFAPPDFLLSHELRMEMMRDMGHSPMYVPEDSESQSHDSMDDDMGQPRIGVHMKHVMKMMQNIPPSLAQRLGGIGYASSGGNESKG
jgi:hypothetical protein